MRALLQRVSEAAVSVDQQTTGLIGPGLLVLLGIGPGDGNKEIEYLVKKILNLRIFNDDQQKMNKSVVDTGGELLVVSQFTLFADCRKGNRPSYAGAAPPALAEKLYQQFVEHLEQQAGSKVQTGVFAADMKVSLVNDGPVTIWLDTANLVGPANQ